MKSTPGVYLTYNFRPVGVEHPAARPAGAPVGARAGEIALYGLGGLSNREELLAKLGKHKTAKACVYIKRLADVDLKVLEKLFASAYKESKKKHGSSK